MFVVCTLATFPTQGYARTRAYVSCTKKKIKNTKQQLLEVHQSCPLVLVRSLQLTHFFQSPTSSPELSSSEITSPQQKEKYLQKKPFT